MQIHTQVKQFEIVFRLLLKIISNIKIIKIVITLKLFKKFKNILKFVKLLTSSHVYNERFLCSLVNSKL